MDRFTCLYFYYTYWLKTQKIKVKLLWPLFFPFHVLGKKANYDLLQVGMQTKIASIITIEATL